MKVATNLKPGKLAVNHNDTFRVPCARRGRRMSTRLVCGRIAINHSHVIRMRRPRG
jgi:hypothetical protein